MVKFWRGLYILGCVCNLWDFDVCFCMISTRLLVLTKSNDAERSSNYFTNKILNPKCVKSNQHSDFCMQFSYSFFGPQPGPVAIPTTLPYKSATNLTTVSLCFFFYHNYMFWFQNLLFEVISWSFGIMFRPENSRAH